RPTVERVRALMSAHPGCCNPVVTGACQALAQEIPENEKALISQLEEPSTFPAELLSAIFAHVDQPFTLMRVCKLWREIEAEEVFRKTAAKIRPGYFTSLISGQMAYPQVIALKQQLQPFLSKLRADYFSQHVRRGLALIPKNRRNSLTAMANYIAD